VREGGRAWGWGAPGRGGRGGLLPGDKKGQGHHQGLVPACALLSSACNSAAVRAANLGRQRAGTHTSSDPNCSLVDVFGRMQLMEAGHKVAAMPVVQHGKVVGLITLHALVGAGL
jgi:hypothetical protein